MDGTRHWLHQEIYAREVGKLEAGYSIHHKDENKDNNVSTNLEKILHSFHAAHHMEDEKRKKTSAAYMTDNNVKMQKLALSAKKGEYIGKSKLRKMNKNNKHKVCLYCGTHFTLKSKDRNDTKYCKTECAQRASKTNRFKGYTPLANTLICTECLLEFKPKTGNQICCTDGCRKKQTEKKRLTNKIYKYCLNCGGNFETIKSSKKKYCSVDCRREYRIKANK